MWSAERGTNLQVPNFHDFSPLLVYADGNRLFPSPQDPSLGGRGGGETLCGDGVANSVCTWGLRKYKIEKMQKPTLKAIQMMANAIPA